MYLSTMLDDYSRYIIALWTERQGMSGFQSVVEGASRGSVDVAPDGIKAVGMHDGYDLSAADIKNDGRPNFTTYETIIRGDPAKVSLYSIRSANSEIQLTYTSFAEWRTSTTSPLPDGTQGTQFDQRYLVYGVETPDGLLSAHTGQATYSGVAYGTGVSASGLFYDVTGTSRFLVDFSSSLYSGSLDLDGRSAAGDLRDFGTWNIASTMAGGFLVQSSLKGPGDHDPGNYIRPRFYGPTGQEIGATFQIRTGGIGAPESVHIVGAAVAREN